MSTSQAGFLARKHDGDDGDLAEAEVEKIQLSEQLDNNNEDKGASTEDDDSEEEFDAEEEARKSEMYEDYNGEDSAALIQGRVKDQSASRKHDGDDGDLAEAEVEKIQLSEQLDNNNEDKGASTDDDDTEEEFDAEEEARKSEMYEDNNGADSAALVQGGAKALSVSRKHDGDDGDLAEAEVEKIQLSEQLDNNNEDKGASTDDDDSEEEFDAEEEARKSGMYEDYNGADSAALVQGGAKARSVSRKHDGDDGDLAEAEVEKIQLSEQLDNNDEEKEDDDSEEEFDAEEEARKSEMYEDYNGADSTALIQGGAKARSVSRRSASSK